MCNWSLRRGGERNWGRKNTSINNGPKLPKFRESINLRTQEVQRTSGRINQEKTTPRCIVVKLRKAQEDHESSRRKRTHYRQGNTIFKLGTPLPCVHPHAPPPTSLSPIFSLSPSRPLTRPGHCPLPLSSCLFLP